ncbi:TPA: manganese efflux pump [Campylobacter coli]|nr:manganese efflux pump [Campylobacter coli]ECH3697587.1 manganese efflux pump [Campylobacter coli]ECQ5882934.1 manganese efflux pump [Campylobacter coli]ECR3049758.1 manganese efflux pump [Campylobacter coli]ECR3230243.1 manganese efflux pump [Campylobacter coli]
MDLYSLIFLSCALAMDAFAVSLCKGFSVKKLNLRHYVITGAYFGGFQALMPAIGYVIGITFASFIASIDHWIAFVLLSLIGLKMIKESFEDESCDTNSNQFGFKIMFALAIATSIDALAIGVSFAFLKVNLFLALFLIGSITFVLCAVALEIGNKFGTRFKNKAEFLGGIVLIALGIKILIEHLFFS